MAALGASLLAALAVPRTGHAIGFELTVPGARDAGRSGASVVGADSAFALFQNPADLLAPTAFTQTNVALHNNWTDLCFQRTLVDQDGSAGQQLPQICGDVETAIIPVGASRFRLGESFAIGFGVYSPPAPGRDLRFGNQDTGTRNFLPASSTASLAPSRYLLMHEHILQVFPTLGAAWSPIKQLRIGAAFGWGVTSFKFSTASWSRAVAVQGPPEIGGTSDVGTYVDGRDTFTPRLQVGVWTKPLPIPLEFAASFVWTGDVQTDDAKLRIKNLYTEYYPSSLTGLIGAGQPDLDARFKGTGVTVPQVSVLSLGARYASKLAQPKGKNGDRLSTERWDIELNLVASFAERMKSIDVEPPRDAEINVPSPSPLVPGVTLELPDQISLAHRWKNQFGIRFGGDYNIIPNFLAVRAGYTFESQGVQNGYHQLDFQPHKRYGFSFGATVRLIDLIDISASYAYFLIPDATNSVEDAGIRRNVTGSATRADAEIANAGTITQDAQSLIVEVGVHL